MDLSFILSESPNGNRQLIRTFTQNAYPVLAFVTNFENLSSLTQDLPGVTWIVLDFNRNPDTVTKFLKVLPIPNYYVSFNNAIFSRCVLEVLQNCGVSFKERERGNSETTLESIVDNDDEEESILVNIVEKRSELKKTSTSLTKKVGKFVRGAKRKINEFTHEDEEENVPLIAHSPPAVADDSAKGFFLSLFSLCCPCFAGDPDPEYCFRNMQELHAQMRAEQIADIGKTFKKLLERSVSKWDVTLLELRRKESQKLEELTMKVEDMRQQEEQRLSLLKDQQNANTRERLSNVLSADLIRKTEESRSRQTKASAKYDADRAYREGHSLILKQVAIDKAQLHERHYFMLVEEQLEKLSEIKTKYQRKSRTLQERYFGTKT